MKKTIITFSIIFLVHFSFSQNTILWKVTDTITDKSSFILGTFHQFGNSFVDSIPQIKERLYGSELAIFESIADVEDSRRMLNQRESSMEIEKRLNKKDLTRLKQLSSDWKVDFYKLEPFEIIWKLTGEFQKTKCKTSKSSDEWDHFDAYLIHLAKENEIDILGLESDSFQHRIIKQIYQYPNRRRGNKDLRYWIDQLSSDSPNMYHCKDADKYRKMELEYNFLIECKYYVAFKQRNDEWMKVLPDLVRNKSCFIAVGFGHLRNKCGLLEQFKKIGFKVEPVEIKFSKE